MESVIFQSLLLLMFLILPTKKKTLILFYTGLTALLVGLIIYKLKNTWLSGLVLLIYVGGLLVLFFYICSLSSKVRVAKIRVWWFRRLFLLVLRTALKFKNGILKGKSASLKKWVRDKLLMDLWSLVIILVIGLWSLRKLNVLKKSSVRPVF